MFLRDTQKFGGAPQTWHVGQVVIGARLGGAADGSTHGRLADKLAAQTHFPSQTPPLHCARHGDTPASR